MPGTRIEERILENGLVLQMFDRSRPVAGDRWLVSFEARIEVEVKPVYLTGPSSPHVPFENIRALVGETASYHYKKERNFIDRLEKEDMLNRLKGDFLEACLGYLSSPGFARRLILRKYAEAFSRDKAKLST